ncbi:MAG: SoxR reducing system RseC family protein [candidate division WOR-3 bacterium]|nr:SoxR reducing system RseC family protein [candidate division WOR-3 bacterium]MCR4423876.1 SoxR reducing system RseC family protein [candidate division WOR-3 bacterium]MDH7519214.1 SoxR reducing system RseC family protein [bacterium]
MPAETPQTGSEEPGVVKTIYDDRAEVEVVPSDSCRHCGAAHLCNWSCERTRTIVARNPIGAKPGDRVYIQHEEKERLRSSLLLFGLPALLMIAGVLIGATILNDRAAVILAGIGLLIAIALVRLIERRRAHSGTGLPVITRRAVENQHLGGQDEKNSDSSADCVDCPEHRKGG